MATERGDENAQAQGSGSEPQISQTENTMVDWGASSIHTSSKPPASETRRRP
jgi:hypothetical protein